MKENPGQPRCLGDRDSAARPGPTAPHRCIGKTPEMRFLTSFAVAALMLSVAAPLAAQAQTADAAAPAAHKTHHHAVHKAAHKTHAKKARVHKTSHRTHHVAKAPVKQS